PEHPERGVAERAELKVNALRDREAHARFERHHFLARSLPAPHLAAALEHVPDLLDRPVGHRRGHLTGGELELGHAAAGETEEDSNVRAVGRDGGSITGTARRRERRHGAECSPRRHYRPHMPKTSGPRESARAIFDPVSTQNLWWMYRQF